MNTFLSLFFRNNFFISKHDNFLDWLSLKQGSFHFVLTLASAKLRVLNHKSFCQRTPVWMLSLQHWFQQYLVIYQSYLGYCFCFSLSPFYFAFSYYSYLHCFLLAVLFLLQSWNKVGKICKWTLFKGLNFLRYVADLFWHFLHGSFNARSITVILFYVFSHILVGVEHLTALSTWVHVISDVMVAHDHVSLLSIVNTDWHLLHFCSSVFMFQLMAHCGCPIGYFVATIPL